MKGWSVRQLDVNNAFLHGILDGNIYMEQPFDYEIKSICSITCHLKKASYSLQQAPRTWYEKLSSSLHSLYFRTSKTNTSLLICVTHTSCCYVLIIINSPEKDLDLLIQSLKSQFSFKDMEKLSPTSLELKFPILLMKVLFLSQYKYITNLLRRTNMQEDKPIATTMVSGPVVFAFQGKSFHYIHMF